MAVEETIVVKVPREALEAGILSTEVATREWFKQLNRRLEGVQQLLTDQVFIDAKERFRKWLPTLYYCPYVFFRRCLLKIL